MAFSIGAILAPVIGGGLADRFGYGSECDIVAGVAMFFSLMYFGLVFLPNFICQRARRIRQLNFSKMDSHPYHNNLINE
jgi:MFS family permease